MTDQHNPLVPMTFFWRRMHSFAGFLLVLFLLEHLLTNSQAALWITSDGSGFVEAVNFIHSLPYLPVIEIALIAAPLLVHAVWGISILFTAAPNSFPSDGRRPDLSQYPRNRAYTWQRVTSWILLILIFAHVAQMRFYNYPVSAQVGHQEFYMVQVGLDDGLSTVAERLNVQLYDAQELMTAKEVFAQIPQSNEPLLVQKREQQGQFLEALEHSIKEGRVVAVSETIGTAFLLVVRETFKMPLMIILYSIFVIAAVFHAFNGLWTFLITWGVSLSERSQKMMLKICNGLMVLTGALGLSAIWLTFWVTLRS